MAAVGNSWRVSVVFRQPTGTYNPDGSPVLAPADPGGTISLYVRDGKGTLTTYVGVGATIVKDAVGYYHADVYCSNAGQWEARFEAGVGSGAAADEATWYVQPSRVLS